MGGLELNLKGVSESVDGVSVLNDQPLEVVNSVDMNLDGSSVDGDFMSEGDNLSSVSVDNPSVGDDFLLLIFAIQLSGLRNRGESQTRDGQDTNKGN